MPPPKVAADDQVIHAFGKAWYFLTNQLGEKGRVPINVSELLPAFRRVMSGTHYLAILHCRHKFLFWIIFWPI